MLVVEDDRSQRDLLRRWLERWGYEVSVAADAREALEVMLADPAEILLADIILPGRDGLWLVEHVRSGWPGTAIIIVSGVVQLPIENKARELGAVDYVTKPFGGEMLRDALKRAEAKLAKRGGADKGGNLPPA